MQQQQPMGLAKQRPSHPQPHPQSQASPSISAGRRPLLSHRAHAVTQSIEQFEQLVAAEDEDSEEEEEQEAGEAEAEAEAEAGESEEEAEDDEDEEAEEHPLQGGELDDADALEEAEEESAMSAALGMGMGGLDPGLFSGMLNFGFGGGFGTLAFDGAGAGGYGGGQLDHAAGGVGGQFEVHHAHAFEGEEDEMLRHESGASSPTQGQSARAGKHSRSNSRRTSGNQPLWTQPPSPSAAAAMQWAPAQPAPALPNPYSRPSSPRLASLRRYSQVDPSMPAYQQAAAELRASQAGSRPMSADIERRSNSSRHSPSASINGPIRPAAGLQQQQQQRAPAFASPPPGAGPRRAPFHTFGNGPVAPRAGAAAAGHPSPPAHGQPVSPAAVLSPPGRAPRTALPALQHSPSAVLNSSRPSSPGPSSRGGGADAAGAAVAPSSNQSSPRFVAPDSRDFGPNGFLHSRPHHQHQLPVFGANRAAPSIQPASAASPSVAPSPPVALLPGGGHFELPPGYEIVRRGAGLAQPHSGREAAAAVAGGPLQPYSRLFEGGEEHKQQQQAPASSPHLQRAMQAVLMRMASQYGVRIAFPGSAASAAGAASAASTTPAVEDESAAQQHEDGDPIEVSFGLSQEDGSAPNPASAPAVPAAPVDFAQKVAALPSFIQAAFADIDEEGGTPREAQTPAESQHLQIQPPTSAQQQQAKAPQKLSPPSSGSASKDSSVPVSPLPLKPLLLASNSQAKLHQHQQQQQVHPMMLMSVDGSTSGDTMSYSPSVSSPASSSGVAFAGDTLPPFVSPKKTPPAVAASAWGSIKQQKGGPPVLPSLAGVTPEEGAAAAREGGSDVSVPVVAHAHVSKSHKPSKSIKRSKKHSSSGGGGGGGGSNHNASTIVTTTTLSNSKEMSSPSGNDRHAQPFKSFKSTLGGATIGDLPVVSSAGGGALRSSRNHNGSSSGAANPSSSSKKDSTSSSSKDKDRESKVSDDSASFAASASISGPVATKPKKKLKKKSKSSSSGGGAGCGGKTKSARMPPVGIHLQRQIPSAPIRCLVSVGKEVWTCEKDGVIVIRDVVTGEIQGSRLRLPGSIVTTLACVGEHVWAGTDAGVLLRIDPLTKMISARSDAVQVPAQASAGMGRTFTSSICIIVAMRERVFTGSADFMIRAWSPHNCAYLRTYSGHSLGIRCLLPMSHTHLWSGSDDRSIRISHVDTGECLQVLTGHTDAVTSLVATGSVVCSASADGSIRVWKLSGSSQSSAEQTQQMLAAAANLADGSAAAAPAVASSGVPLWECVQVVNPGLGRISALLLVGRTTRGDQLWSVGQHENVVVWNVGAAASSVGSSSAAGDASSARGHIVLQKWKELTGAHSSFITGLAMVRKSEVKTIWSHSLSTTPAVAAATAVVSPAAASSMDPSAASASAALSTGAGDQLCCWSYVVHNGRDLAEQLQVAKDKYHSAIMLLRTCGVRDMALRRTLAQDRAAFQIEAQQLIMSMAQLQAEVINKEEACTALRSRCNRETDALDSLRSEHAALQSTHAALESRLCETKELHEEETANLKQYIAQKEKQRSMLQASLERATRDAEEMEARADAEAARAASLESRACDAEQRCAELQSQLVQERARADAAALQAAQSQLVSQAEEALLSELSSTRKAAAEAEAARAHAAAQLATVTRRSDALEGENELLRAQLQSNSDMNALARDLQQLSAALERSKKNASESLSKPLRLLSRETIATRQNELVNAASALTVELTDAARLVRSVMNQHLTDVQMLHVGASSSYAAAGGGAGAGAH